jgi:hypothetical protein
VQPLRATGEDPLHVAADQQWMHDGAQQHVVVDVVSSRAG